MTYTPHPIAGSSYYSAKRLTPLNTIKSVNIVDTLIPVVRQDPAGNYIHGSYTGGNYATIYLTEKPDNTAGKTPIVTVTSGGAPISINPIGVPPTTSTSCTIDYDSGIIYFMEDSGGIPWSWIDIDYWGCGAEVDWERLSNAVNLTYTIVTSSTIINPDLRSTYYNSSEIIPTPITQTLPTGTSYDGLVLEFGNLGTDVVTLEPDPIDTILIYPSIPLNQGDTVKLRYLYSLNTWLVVT